MRAGAASALACLLAVSACTAAPARKPDTDEQRIDRYFTAFNAAGREGAEQQAEFVRDSQHPDVPVDDCDLDDHTLDVYAALSTLRPDPDWAPEGGEPPRGEVYVVSVSLTLRRAGALVGEQIGTERVAVLDGKVVGLTPCP